MKRKISIIRYIIVFILTVLIFGIGILIGGNLEDLRVKHFYSNLEEQNLAYNDVLTEKDYINYLIQTSEKNQNPNCDFLNQAYSKSIVHLDIAREKLDQYMNSASTEQEQYNIIKGRYANLQINYWLLFKRIKLLCPSNRFTILYLYKDKKSCPSCEDQGTHLMYVKKKLGDKLMLFSLDAEREGPNQMIVKKHNLQNSEYPVLIINETVYGFLDNTKIFKILCNLGLKDNVCLN